MRCDLDRITVCGAGETFAPTLLLWIPSSTFALCSGTDSPCQVVTNGESTLYRDYGKAKSFKNPPPTRKPLPVHSGYSMAHVLGQSAEYIPFCLCHRIIATSQTAEK